MTTAQKVELTVPVKDGRLAPSDGQRAIMDGFLATREGKAVVVKLSRPANTRSQRQNAYYWAHVVPEIARATFNTPEDTHRGLKELFLPRKFIVFGGRQVEARLTTTDLTVEEFSTYLKSVAAWAASEHGVLLDTEV